MLFCLLTPILYFSLQPAFRLQREHLQNNYYAAEMRVRKEFGVIRYRYKCCIKLTKKVCLGPINYNYWNHVIFSGVIFSQFAFFNTQYVLIIKSLLKRKHCPLSWLESHTSMNERLKEWIVRANKSVATATNNTGRINCTTIPSLQHQNSISKCEPH